MIHDPDYDEPSEQDWVDFNADALRERLELEAGE